LPDSSINPEVVVIGANYPDSFAENIADALTNEGIAVQHVDPRGRYSRPGSMTLFSKPRRYVTEATKRFPRLREVLVDKPVAEALRDTDPALVICTWGLAEPEQIEQWRRETPGAVWALWYPDALSNLGRQQMLQAPYDYLFFKDAYLVDQLRDRAGLPAHLLPQACNPARHRTEAFRDDDERKKYECDVAVVGNVYPFRGLVLDAIPESVDLRLYGNLYEHVAKQWPRLRTAYSGEYVTGRTKALAFRGAKIAFNTMHYAEIQGTNLRLFESSACGGFVLTHDIAGLDAYFTPGEEVAVVDSADEVRDAVMHYLNAPEERARIAAAGQRRAHRDHTYRRRFEVLFDVCGLDGLRRALR
jgi:spore maturation protein CgeB